MYSITVLRTIPLYNLLLPIRTFQTSKPLQNFTTILQFQTDHWFQYSFGGLALYAFQFSVRLTTKSWKHSQLWSYSSQPWGEIFLPKTKLPHNLSLFFHKKLETQSIDFSFYILRSEVETKGPQPSLCRHRWKRFANVLRASRPLNCL